MLTFIDMKEKNVLRFCFVFFVCPCISIKKYLVDDSVSVCIYGVIVYVGVLDVHF